LQKQKGLIGQVLEGKAAAPAGKGSFASLPLEKALEEFTEARKGRVAERTSQIDAERSKGFEPSHWQNADAQD
jgi:hypothetical protein